MKITDKELVKKLTEASEAYYNTDSKIMSDEEFDLLEKEYQKRFGKKFIGAKAPSTKGTINVEHQYANLVGTLAKVKTIDEFMEWYDNCMSKLSVTTLPSLYVTLKYDGNSIVIEYKDGLVNKVLTRGKDGKGLDLTHAFKDYHELEFIKDECGIKYEVIMTYEDFERLMEDENISYANPRSIVAGKLGCDDAAKYSEYFTLVPLWLKYKDKEITREKELNDIKKEFGEDWTNFVGKYTCRLRPNSVKKDLEGFYEKVMKIRDDLPFMIDGLVIEFTDENIRKQLGMNTGFPNWAIALKFPYMEKSSKVTGFDYCLGDTGRITPRVWFEPVDFNGTVHEKQSLQNYDRYNKLNLSIGSDILVQYRNDCLTYIERLDTENNKKLDKKKKDEKILCPECGTEAVPNDTKAFIYCPNDMCPGKVIGKIQNFLIKMDIKGIKENMLIMLNNEGLVKSIEDLYTMDYSLIKDIKGMGARVATNIRNAIQTRVPYDYEILGAMGITNCSTMTAKDICKVYTLAELMKMLDKKGFINTLMDIEGVADITANYIKEGLENNRTTIDFLLKRKHIIYKEEMSKATTDKQEVIVFTGFRDKDAQAKLELMGHKITGSVSKKTTIVVAKDVNGSSSSIKKAKELNIRVLSVEEFKKEFNL